MAASAIDRARMPNVLISNSGDFATLPLYSHSMSEKTGNFVLAVAILALIGCGGGDNATAQPAVPPIATVPAVSTATAVPPVPTATAALPTSARPHLRLRKSQL
jgi:hypothetical protein